MSLCVAGGNAFTPEGDGQTLALSERERQLADFSVRHDGIRYRYNGYAYDRWEDAVAQARLMRARLGQTDASGPLLARRQPPVVTEAEDPQ